jgi:hypothetical protein
MPGDTVEVCGSNGGLVAALYKENWPHGEDEANARLIAAAPDHALICWAMCVQDAAWEEWTPFDGRGEFCFAGLRYATRLDEFGCPALTPALRAAITQSQSVPA